MMKINVLLIGIQLVAISGFASGFVAQLPKVEFQGLYNAATDLEEPLEDFFEEIESDASDFDAEDIEQAVDNFREGNWEVERTKRAAPEKKQAAVVAVHPKEPKPVDDLKLTLKNNIKKLPNEVRNPVESVLENILS